MEVMLPKVKMMKGLMATMQISSDMFPTVGSPHQLTKAKMLEQMVNQSHRIVVDR